MNKKEVNTVAPVSKFGIVNKVAAMLNLGDFGKVENFISKVSRTLNREVDTLQRDIDNLKHNYKSELGRIEEALEDAEMALEEAYTNIDPANLKTNEAQRDYMEVYLSQIDKAEAKVLGIKESISEMKKDHDKEIEELKEEIKVRKTRISKLTKK